MNTRPLVVGLLEVIEDFLQGGGETGDLIRALDWSATDLGPFATWSPVLRTLVGTIVNMKSPMVVLWGEHYVQVYNDGYRDVLQARHPRALGERGMETWRDEWAQVQPLHDEVLGKGRSLVFNDFPFQLTRQGFVEETYFDLSYTPVHELDGQRVGILVSLVETTRRVLGERRLKTLQRLTQTFNARTLGEGAKLGIAALEANSLDIPFALLYVQAAAGKEPSLVAARGIADETSISAEMWPWREALRQRAPLVTTAFGPTVVEALAQTSLDCYRAVTLPVEGTGDDSIAGVLVVGLSARLDFDDAYCRFLVSVASELGAALANARAHENEQLARARLADVLESISDAFYVLDREWNFVLVNEAHERMTERSRSEMLGRSVWELFPEAAAPDSVYWRTYHRCMETSQPAQFVDHYAPLGKWTEVRVYPTIEGIAVFVRDVSVEYGVAETQRRQAEFEQHLVGIVSHDLRNPLSVIRLGASALLREERDARTTKTIVRINSSADRAIRLVGDLLDFTQARLGGGIPLDPKKLDIRTLVAQVVEEVEAIYPERTVRVEASGDGEATWDGDRMAQVLTNLVTNALKYSSPDTPITVRTTGAEKAVEITVHNEGVPIPRAAFPLLFEPMKRAASSFDRANRSVGLGLYIVKHVVDAHGGRVTVTSNAEAGTTFTVQLPRTPTPCFERAARLS